MYYYSVNQTLAASFLPDLPFPSAEAGIPKLFLLNRDPAQGPAVFRATHANQLFRKPLMLRGWTPIACLLHRNCPNLYKLL